LEKSEFPVSPELQDSHWLNGDKHVITLAMADHEAKHKFVFGGFLDAKFQSMLWK